MRHQTSAPLRRQRGTAVAFATLAPLCGVNKGTTVVFAMLTPIDTRTTFYNF